MNYYKDTKKGIFMGAVKEWAVELERDRQIKLDNLAEYVYGREQFIDELVERLEIVESIEARLDFLESQQKTEVESVDGVKLEITSIMIKRGVVAYGLKSLGKNNREIAAILWPDEEYQEEKHATYIRRDVRAAKNMLANLKDVLAPEKK